MITIDENTFPARQRGDDTTAEAANRWLVVKFGGTSVSTVGRWQTIAELMRERLAAGFRTVVVHSALGGVSNQIDAALDAAVVGEHEEELDAIVATHLDLALELGLDGQNLLATDLAEMQQLLAGIRLIREVSPRVHVKVMALGELMATRLGAAYLQSQGIVTTWVDARDVLCSVDVPHENERSRYLSASCGFVPLTNSSEFGKVSPSGSRPASSVNGSRRLSNS